MITESKVTEIFCIADDFCKEFEVEMAKNALPSTTVTSKRKRKRMMSDAEVITILICFHFNSYRNFKLASAIRKGRGVSIISTTCASASDGLCSTANSSRSCS